MLGVNDVSLDPAATAGGESAAVTMIVKLCVLVPPSASVAVTVKVKVPAVVGVPVIVPSAASDNPGGSVPPVAVHVTGGVGEVASSDAEYGDPILAVGRLALVVMQGGCVAPRRFVFHPAKVLQVRVTVGVGSGPTSIPVPVASGGTDAVRPTALLEIVTLVLEKMKIPLSLVPVMVLLSMVTLAASNSRNPVAVVVAAP